MQGLSIGQPAAACSPEELIVNRAQRSGRATRPSLRTAGATDATSAVASYWYRTWSDNGTTWSLTDQGPGGDIYHARETARPVPKAVDAAGNATAWAPATAGAANTACHT
jgi:hypothetical protein